MMVGGARLLGEAVLRAWTERHGLTQAEVALLRLVALDGIPRSGLAE